MPDDLILAFFPCVRFENQIMLSFRGQLHGMEKWNYKQKMLHDMKLLQEVRYNYNLVNMLFILCIDRGLKLVMENPYSEEHFLRRYWCYPASIIDKDRRKEGDYFKKPTQYWFLNMEPKENLVFEPIDYYGEFASIEWMNKETVEKVACKTVKHARSAISPQYANRFIRKYLIDEVNK